ncbi:acetylxylan esterase [Aquimarina sp. RZ0]|uniref:acetylxylan esterase n=1 Tax=Aquimarina sp. RZ0 TaxID=2607730 RepID=UPI0011F1C152|nr:acetylxylan esterase [Aquimarina sp. RZ0]KAA1242365.1 acetylxylan esterase [Aquimarina sp. RZ0]
MKKETIFYLILNSIILSGYAQNLIPLDWTLAVEKPISKEKTLPVNLLRSWVKQEISSEYSGDLRTTFFVPAMKEQTDFTLEVTLLADIDSIYINNHYIGGGFTAKPIWANYNKVRYEAKKLVVPHSCLKFNKENHISILSSKYAYTGGKSHNAVKLYASTMSNSSIKIQFPYKNHLYHRSDQVSSNLIIEADTTGTASISIQNDLDELVFTRQIQVDKGKKTYVMNLASQKLKPGFYTVIAILKDKGYTGTRSFFTVSPTKIKPSSTEPEGFNDYWKKALDELKSVKPKFKIKKVDSLCTEKRNGYIVHMQSIGDKTIYGYYFRPKKKGKFATILHVPGYGYGFEYLDGFLNSKEDVVELAFCVRGHGLSKKAFHTEFPVPGFFGHKICDRDSIAYRQIYMDCIRAVDFLVSRQEVDSSRIGVTGSSQGGGLALMTAGLASEHISACAYGNPFPVDLKNLLRIIPLVQDVLKGFIAYYNDDCNYEEGLQTFDFFDARHFAKHIKGTTFYVTGLEDDDCPPRLGFSTYNEINAPKQFLIYPNDSHVGESNWGEAMMDFFKKEFKF